MRYNKTKVNPAGLMRCCIKTLEDFLDLHADEECTKGETLSCIYEAPGNNAIILENGMWRWNS